MYDDPCTEVPGVDELQGVDDVGRLFERQLSPYSSPSSTECKAKMCIKYVLRVLYRNISELEASKSDCCSYSTYILTDADPDVLE